MMDEAPFCAIVIEARIGIGTRRKGNYDFSMYDSECQAGLDLQLNKLLGPTWYGALGERLF